MNADHPMEQSILSKLIITLKKPPKHFNPADYRKLFAIQTEIVPEMTECLSVLLVRTIVWLRLQSYIVKLLAMVLVYSGGGGGGGRTQSGKGCKVTMYNCWSWSLSTRGGESQSFLVKNYFLSPNNFRDVDHRALVLSDR